MSIYLVIERQTCKDMQWPRYYGVINMNQTSSRSIVESGLLTALMIIFAMIGLSVPMLGFFGSILVPMTIAIVGVRHGLRWSVLSVVAAVIVIAFLLGPLTALIEGGVFGVIGILIGYGLRQKWSISKLLLLPAIVLMISVAFQFWVSAWMVHMDPVQMWTSLEQEIETSMREVYVQQGLGEDQVSLAMTTLQQQIDIMKKVLVAGLFCSGIAISYIINRLTYMVVNRIGTYDVPEMPTIQGWRIPDWALHVFLVGLISYFVKQYVPGLEYIGYNLMYLGGIMLFIRGLSCAWRITKTYNPPKFVQWLVLIVLLFMSQSAAIFGAIDVFMNLENRWKKRTE